MKIQLFLDKTGLIHGTDTGKITASVDGTLTIGREKIEIKAHEDSTLPKLLGGSIGVCEAHFDAATGEKYTLNSVSVRGGYIVPPNALVAEIMELKRRADEAEKACREMRKKIHELEHIFDTNSLNFLIK